VEGSLYYLFVYTFMVIGTFAVVTVVGGPGDGRHDLERYRGLASRQPWLAGGLTVLLMAQAGIPFTTGFLAKLEVIEAAVRANSDALAVVAMVTAVIAAFFYLRVILLMYSSSAGLSPSSGDVGADPITVGLTVGSPSVSSSTAGSTGTAGALVTAAVDVEVDVDTVAAEDGGTGPIAVAPTVAVAIAVCVAVTVLFGLWPAPVVNFAHHALLYSKSLG
jgi:NADH-quinone oxidoreductase subunit N